MTALLQAVNALGDRLMLAQTIGQSFDAVAGDDGAPSWVYVYRRQIDAIQEAAEALETLVRGLDGASPHGSEAKQPRRRTKGASSRLAGLPAGVLPSRHDKQSPGPENIAYF